MDYILYTVRRIKEKLLSRPKRVEKVLNSKMCRFSYLRSRHDGYVYHVLSGFFLNVHELCHHVENFIDF